MPGSGHLIGGRTAYLKLRRGDTVEELALRDAEGRMLGGLKMANGTNSQRAAPFPGGGWPPRAGEVGVGLGVLAG